MVKHSFSGSNIHIYGRENNVFNKKQFEKLKGYLVKDEVEQKEQAKRVVEYTEKDLLRQNTEYDQNSSSVINTVPSPRNETTLSNVYIKAFKSQNFNSNQSQINKTSIALSKNKLKNQSTIQSQEVYISRFNDIGISSKMEFLNEKINEKRRKTSKPKIQYKSQRA